MATLYLVQQTKLFLGRLDAPWNKISEKDFFNRIKPIGGH